MTQLRPESLADVLRDSRLLAGISRSEMARRLGTSRSALLEYESGTRVPRADGFLRFLDETGATITVSLGTPRSVRPTLADAAAHLDGDDAWKWRALIGDFVANEYVPASAAERRCMLRDMPAALGDVRWDSFVAALAEHLAFHAEVPCPQWAHTPGRQGLPAFWWPVHGELRSMRASAFAHSPASFRRRRILIDQRELPTVSR